MFTLDDVVNALVFYKDSKVDFFIILNKILNHKQCFDDFCSFIERETISGDFFSDLLFKKKYIEFFNNFNYLEFYKELKETDLYKEYEEENGKVI